MLECFNFRTGAVNVANIHVCDIVERVHHSLLTNTHAHATEIKEKTLAQVTNVEAPILQK